MGRITNEQFRRVPLHVHRFLGDVLLHDAWAIDLPRRRAGVTLDEFLRLTNGRLFAPFAAARALLRLRFTIGRFLGWDAEPAIPGTRATFSDRLTAADRASSLVPAGTSDGPFRVVYWFENEQLDEILNKTVHAAKLVALVEGTDSYRFFLGVYVRSVGPMTPLYMALIAPLRRLIVYPSLLRSVRKNWDDAIRAGR